MKCQVCDQDIIMSPNTGESENGMKLCYLHLKYAERFTGPYHETIYDLVWWKQTFLTMWNKTGLPKIIVSTSEKVGVMKKIPLSFTRVVLMVKEQLKNPTHSLESFRPLNLTVASYFSRRSDIPFRDLFNEGFLCLIKLSHKIDPSADPKMVSAFVKRRLWGAIQNYVTQYNGIIRNPKTNSTWWDGTTRSFSVAEEITTDSGELNPEQHALRKESCDKLLSDFDKLSKKCSRRQRVILGNMVQGNEQSQIDLAKRLKVTTRTIRRETKKILAMAKEIKDGGNG